MATDFETELREALATAYAYSLSCKTKAIVMVRRDRGYVRVVPERDVEDWKKKGYAVHCCTDGGVS